MNLMLNRPIRVLTTLAAVAALAGCAVGPDYHRPTLAVAPAYKEQGWNPAQPADLAHQVLGQVLAEKGDLVGVRGAE